MSTARYILYPLLALALFVATGAAETRIDLDRGWQFRTDPKARGEAEGWTTNPPSETEEVRVPHTWNIGPNDDFEGLAWYFHTCFLGPRENADHMELHFGGTFYKSKVWLNGTLLGGHEGGHTEYWFDVSALLRPGKNYIAVELDNRPTIHTIPGVSMRDSGRWYDWWHYGGIVRDVWLSSGPAISIRRQTITTKVTSEGAEVSTEVMIENHSDQSGTVSVQASAYSPEGSVSGESAVSTIRLDAGGSIGVPLRVHIAKPQMWGVDHPSVYHMNVVLTPAGPHKDVDLKRDSFGIKTVEIKEGHFYLNHEQVRLTGMTRHEDSPWEGLAETSGTIKHDYEELKQLHVTLTRPAHYPQNELVLDYADEHGILLIPEIPIWQFSPEQLGDPKVLALAKQMMREMIEQQHNHPSIWAWSLCNESAVASESGHAFIKQMKALVNQLDPDRFVSYASDALAIAPEPGLERLGDVDFIMLNAYWGTFHGAEAAMVPALDRIAKAYPHKMMIVSEFGAPGNFAGNSVDGDALRIHIMQTQMQEFARRDWIAGAIFWTYADYKSHHGIWPGYTEGYDDIGVVDENRQRRPSYFAWQKLNEPVVIEAELKLDASNNPVGFDARIRRKTLDELPSYPLRNYVALWEVRDRDGSVLQQGKQLLPNLDESIPISTSWPRHEWVKETLTLRLADPHGNIVGERTLNAVNGRFGGEQPRQPID